MQTGVLESPNKYKKPPNTNEAFLRTGMLEGSIPDIDWNLPPEHGDYRKGGGFVWEYDKGKGEYKKIMSIFNPDVAPEDGATVLMGNKILTYSKGKNEYKQLHEIPSAFIGSKTKPDPPTGIKDWMTRTLPHSIGKTAGDLATLGSALVNPLTGRIAAKEGEKPGSVIMPQTDMLTKESSTRDIRRAIGSDIGNIATAPVQMAVKSITHPLKMFKEDPAQFAMGLMVAHGGIKALKTYSQLKAVNAMKAADFVGQYIESSIPEKVFSKYGIPKTEFIAKLREPPNLKKGRPSDYVDPAVQSASSLPEDVLGIKGIDKAEFKQKMAGTELDRPVTDIGGNMPGLGERLPRLPKDTPNITPKSKVLAESLDTFADPYKMAELWEGSKPPFDPSKVEKGRPSILSEEPRGMTKGGMPDIGERLPAPPKPPMNMFDIAESLPPEPGLPNLKTPAEIDAMMKMDTPKKGMTQVGIQVGNVMRRRISRIQNGVLHGMDKIRRIADGLTKEERASIPYIREGVQDIPGTLGKIGREDLVADVSNPSARLKIAVKRVGDLYEQDKAFMEKNYNAEQFVDDYVTRLWEVPSGRRSGVIEHFKKNNPFLKERTIESLEKGINELGLKPKTTDIVELYDVYNRYKHTVVSNLEAYRTLKGMSDPYGRPYMTGDRPKFGPNQTDPFSDYVEIKSSAFPNGKAWVHPDIKSAAEALFATTPDYKIDFSRGIKGMAEKAGATVDAFNHTVKYLNLSATLFHHGALFESAMAALNPYGAGKAVGKSIVNMAKGRASVTQNMELASDAVKNGGVLVGHPQDFDLGVIERGLSKIESTAPEPQSGLTRILGKKAVATGVKAGVKGWNSFLWDHLHTNMKLMSYEKLLGQQMARATKQAIKEGGSLSKTDVLSIKRQVGEFVNDAFGGQNWKAMNNMLADPKHIRNLHRILLAPDWTISVVRQATAPLRGVALEAAGKGASEAGFESMGRDMTLRGQTLKNLGTSYWKRMLAYTYLIVNGTNMAATEFLKGEPRLAKDNPPGSKTNIYIGKGAIGKELVDGQELYISYGKQIHEPLRWFEDPVKLLGSKSSPMVRGLVEQLSGHQAGSGWPTSFQGTEGAENISKRVETIATSFLPFSLRGVVEGRGNKTFMLMYPVKKGMTPRGTKELIGKAMKIPDEQERQERMAEIAYHAKANDINWRESYASAMQESDRKEVWRNEKYLDKFRKELKDVDTVDGKVDMIRTYRDKNALTSAEARRLAGELQERAEVQKLITNADNDISYLKRITSNKGVAVEEEYKKMRDGYTATRSFMTTYALNGDLKKVISTAFDWNKTGLKSGLEDLGKSIGVPKGRILISPVFKNNFMTPQKIINLVTTAAPEYKSQIEKLLKMEIK